LSRDHPLGELIVRSRLALLTILAVAASCVTEPEPNPLDRYEEVPATTILDAPHPRPGLSAPGDRDLALRGEYLVELLACGACHTDGALIGEPKMDKPLAGSQVGIAWSNPLGDEYPGVVYPPNITPDLETGIGAWSDRQISNAVRSGIGRHGDRRISAMPWRGYATISNEDIEAITAYLRSIEPISHAVPAEVSPGSRARYPFVYFGVYRSR
jgi:mono/diheme cytochrome c family protein